tara:strand:+ start:241 stop:1050 length:810 start_codon:yes stop_codon:yes gene_type:complete
MRERKRPRSAKATPRPRVASPAADEGATTTEDVDGERGLVASLVNDHLLAFKDASASVGVPWSDVVGNGTDRPSKLAQLLDDVLQRTDAVSELCKSLKEELLRAVTDEGRPAVASAFRGACFKTHVAYNLQLDRLHSTQNEANTLLANAGVLGSSEQRLDLVEEGEPLVERYVQELASEVADLFFGDEARLSVVEDDDDDGNDDDDEEDGSADHDEASAADDDDDEESADDESDETDAGEEADDSDDSEEAADSDDSNDSNESDAGDAQ